MVACYSFFRAFGFAGAALVLLIALLPHLLSNDDKYPSALPSHIVTLDNGRQLGYLEYGNPKGFPILILHSFLQGRTSHPEGLLQIDQRLGARVLVLDRAGYGTSTPAQNDYTLLHAAEDVREFADKLSLERFSIIGISAGAVYALAATTVIPATRLTSVVLLSPAHPDPYQENSEFCVLPVLDTLKHVAYYAPILPRLLFNFFRWWCVHTWPQDAFPPYIMKMAFTSDEFHHFKTQRSWDTLTRSCMESMSSGVDGVLTDLRLISMRWPFEISSINQDPANSHNIYMWHGGEDSIVSVGCAQHYETIPNLKPTYCPSCGHGLLANESMWEDVLTSILSHAD